MHLGAAHFLQCHFLADHHLRHARRAQVHAGVTVDHHHHVAKRGDVGAARGRRPKQQAQLRDLPAHLHLIVEDAPCAATAGEHLDLIGDARPGRVDQIQERAGDALRGLLNAQDLLDRALAPRARFDGRVIGHDRYLAAAHARQARDHAVRGQVTGGAVGEQRVLAKRICVDQMRDAFTREQLALLRVLLVVLRGPARERARPCATQL